VAIIARKKTAPEKVRLRNRLAERLKEIRIEKYGEHAGPEFARQLKIPAETWRNYEMGVTVPAEVIVRFIELISVDPRWLLFGLRKKYRPQASEAVTNDAVGESARSVPDSLNRAFERLEKRHLVINVSWKKSE
jgi:hypothetical protein